MTAELYYAFTETVESVRNHIHVRFDMFSANRLAGLAAMPEKELAAAFLTLPTPVLVADLSSREANALRNMLGRRPESRWFAIRLDEQGLPAFRYPDLEADGPESVFISSLEAVPARGKEGQDLRRVFALGRHEAASDHSLGDLSGTSRTALRVLVYRVGQGSASAIANANNEPLLYFDLGGGCAWNSKTYRPRPLAFDWTQGPAVVLSHWDFDHYFSGYIDSQSWQRTWIVPDQGPISPTPAKLLARIVTAGGRIALWRGGGVLSMGPVTLVRPKPTAGSRNQSGLILRVDLGGDDGPEFPVLLTGDGCYDDMRHHSGGLAGLVATHHGSGRHVGIVPAGAAGAPVVYSYGTNNVYKHPTKGRPLHHAAGWTYALDTPKGNVVIAPTPSVNPHSRLAPWDDVSPVQQ